MAMRYDGQKPTMTEVRRFVEFAVKDQRLVASIQEQKKLTPSMPDDEREIITGKTVSLVVEYINRNGINWRYRGGFTDALSLVQGIIDGEIEGIDDPRVYGFLKYSPFIDSEVK